MLKEKSKQFGSIISLGMDPVLEQIPSRCSTSGESIVRFYTEILEACRSEDVMPGAVKPNSAFFEQYGLSGLKALKDVIGFCKQMGLPVILDVKRGDIGKTSLAYAHACFDFWQADAVTLNPYMGKDVVDPFVPFLEKGKGAYVLCKTSNAGAACIQDVACGNNKLFEHVAQEIVKWHVPGMGAVVGATFPDELGKLAERFASSGKELPLLIPGVGAQGGDLSRVLKVLQKSGGDLRLHRINSSSGINYAHLKEKTDDFAGAAVRELKRLNSECKGFL